MHSADDDFVFDVPSSPIARPMESPDSQVTCEAGDPRFWSNAKRRAWELMRSNPNSYYYRHCDPHEVQKTGPWDADELELFKLRAKECPPCEGKWGIFAQGIPGRVGYQCRNFYHRLLKEKKIDLSVEEHLRPGKKGRRKGKKTEVIARESPQPEPSEEEDLPDVTSLTFFSSSLSSQPDVVEEEPQGGKEEEEDVGFRATIFRWFSKTFL
jgi:hypothetical protein